MKTVKAVVAGQVQGVSFRWHVRTQAQHFGVKGFVRNLDDGRVELLAQADPEVLERFMQEVRKGPEGSRVTSVREEFPEYKHELGPFEIR